MEPVTDFPNRLSIRSIAAGVVSVFALMTLSMSLAGVLRLWGFTFWQLPSLGGGFWAWESVSWVACVYAGSYIATTVSQARTKQEGSLYGFLTWASSGVLGMLFLNYFYGGVFGGTLEDFRPTAMLWGGFLGNLAALGASIVAGLRARKTSVTYKNVGERKRAA